MLYHVSATAGIRTLIPRESSHQAAYVYAIDNPVTGLLFGAKHDDFDFLIDEEAGIPVVYECYPDAFRERFQGKSCTVYTVPDNGFRRDVTGWDPELVCDHPVDVLSETAVPDLYSRLLEEAAAGHLRLNFYQSDAAYRHLIAGHIVDRLIRFDVLDRQSTDPRFQKYFGPICDALRSAMDGHLLI